MKEFKLQEIAEINSGQGAPQKKNDFVPKENGIPFVRAGSLEFLERGLSLDLCEHVSAETANKYKLKLFSENTILFAKSGMSSKKGRIYKLYKPAYVVNHLAAIFPKKNLDPNFLLYWFKKYPPNNLINDDAYPSIRLSDIQKIKIPLPPLETQKQIAAVLDKADELRQKKKYANAKLDELLQSVFLDMFGDPVRNPKGWEKCLLKDDLLEVQNGLSRRRKIPENTGQIVLRLREIRANTIDYSDINRIPLEKKEINKYKVDLNDLLFIRVNGNKDYVGRCAIFKDNKEDVYFNDHIMRVKLNENRLTPCFISRFLNSKFGKMEIKKHIKTSAGQFTISQQGLEKINLYYPPLDLQNKFAQIVEKVEEQKAKNEIATKKLDDLFNSLLQRAFKGELELARELVVV